MTKMDSEDEFKRRMRRRLVGAVALVTALVVILPMLLESSPKPREGSLELRIPDKDTSGAFTSQMVVPESAPDVTPLPEAGAAASTPAAAATQTAPAQPDAKAEATHKPAKAEHKTEPKAAEAKTDAHKAGFAVQVGAFSHAAAARELQDKLSKQGWHAYTQKAGGTVRVRIGPYSARAEAEKAQRKLAAQGVHPAAVVAEP
jgi:DedD protein